MRLTVRHATTYTYDPPADRCALRLRLYPPTFSGQRVLKWTVSVNEQVVPALMTTATGDRESIWTRANAGA
ncbi:MAG TPA: transglutaminase N-terminal domain-containing protein, partial [Hyphomonadaceae bacterium]|nr:transglutaminase N-terminal domain-containing protein [Hyphomonadaceae bacterium]